MSHPGPVLLTARLRLVPAGRDDAPVLLDLWRNPIVRRYLWDDIVITPAQAAGVIEESLETFAQHLYGLWCVISGDDLAGFVMLRSTEELRRLELLFGLYPAFFGKGLASESAQSAVDHAFESIGAIQIIAGVDPPNVSSVRVLDRLKFVYDGERLFGPKRCLAYSLSHNSHRALNAH